MRLIDAGWLVDRLRWKTFDTNPEHFDLDTMEGACMWSTNNGINAGLTMAETEIENCKTIDAVPIRHGHWVMHADDLFPPDSTQECSVCHADITAYIEHFEYCPHCGSKMDGDTDA